MHNQFTYPDELALLEYFASEPTDRVPNDGYWLYEVTDKRGITLRFSFNTHEHSVQTVLLLSGEIIETVCHEGAEALTIDGKNLNCIFKFEDSKALLVIKLEPYITISWSTLRTR